MPAGTRALNDLAVAAHSPVSPHLGVLSTAFVNDLESRHLRAFRAEHSSSWGAGLRSETRAWAELKVGLAATVADACAELTLLLSTGPRSAIPDPETTALELLTHASPLDHEERHLRQFMAEHSSSWGNELRREVLAWVTSRIQIARTQAHGMVHLAHAQESFTGTPRLRAPEPAAGASPLRGAVARINEHGAVITLDSGEQGWLHISALRVLNRGLRVDSVTAHLRVGQELDVRRAGTTPRGQAHLELRGPSDEDSDR